MSKMPKKLKVFSLKIHKGTGIFKNPKEINILKVVDPLKV